MDKFTPEKRSEIMGKIKGKDTKSEMKLRQALFSAGIRGYRIHKRISGIRPDIAFIGKKVAIFLDGCFWHGCPICFKMPATRQEYWIPKINGNMERDIRNTEKLKSEGWIVMRFWEHELKRGLPDIIAKIKAMLDAITENETLKNKK